MFRLGIIHPYLFGGTPVGRPEDDGSCNINNVLYPHQIKQDLPSDQLNSVTMATVTPEATTAEMVASIPKESEKKASAATISSAAPGSTTADLAKAAPIEHIEQRSNVPGTFPETPRQESETFSVNPIPASGTSGNPIKLKPGEKVPDPSTFTSNTIQSTARTDPAGYAQDPIASIMGGQSEEFETSAFAIPPVSQNIILESSLPMGEPIQGFSDPGVIIQSAAPTATTASLAAAVPLESQRHQINGGGVVDGVPEVVRESITEAHKDPEATVNRQMVEEKKEMENQLQRKVPKEESTATPSPSTTTTADLATSEMDGSTPVGEVPAPVTHSIIEAHKDPEAATDRQVVEEKKEMENELLERVPKEESTGAPAPSTTTTAGPTTTEMNDSTPVDEVPAPVKHSIAEAHEEPEAAADTQVVEEKKETEDELLEKVPKEESTGTPAPSITTAGLTAAELSSTPVDEVPTPVKHSIAEAHEEPEAAADTQVVEEKKEMENELQKNVPKEESTGTPAASMTAADPTTAEMSSTPVDEVPTPVKHSITEAHKDPEAASNREVIEVKKEVENELQQVVPREDSAGTPAPTAEAAATETVPSATESIAEMDGSTLVDEVPTPVKHSITEAHKDPEAASNREVIEVKNEVEDELQQKVPREESMGAPAPTTTATMAETVPWAMESTVVGLATAEVNDNAPVDEVPVPVKHSIAEAYKDPEAAANREAVEEKKEVEDELQEKIPREDSAGNSAPTTTAATTETAPQATRIQPEPEPVSTPQGPTVTTGVREANVPEVSSPEAEPTTPISDAVPDKAATPEPETAPQATEIQPELEPVYTGTSAPQGPIVTTGVREANVPEVSSPEAESTAPIPNATPDKAATPEPETAPQATGVQPESEPVSPGTSVPQGPTVTTGFGEVNALEVPSPGMELIPFMRNTIPDKPATSGSETSESSIPPNEMSAPTGQTQPAATPNWRYEAAHQTNGNHTYGNHTNGMKNEVKEKKKKKSVWSRLRGKLKQGPVRDASTR